MENVKPVVRKMVKVSSILPDIKQHFKTLKVIQSDIDGDYFDDEEMESYLQFLAEEHKDDWILIDDRNEQK